jgi:hypothetical protein
MQKYKWQSNFKTDEKQINLTESSYLTEKLGVKLRIQLFQLIIQRLLCVIKALISGTAILACTVAAAQRMVVCS